MARGGARSKATLKYDREAYYLDALKSGSLTEKEMQAEYTRLSKIAVKRLERFEKSKEWHDADIYRQYAGSFEQPVSSMSHNQLMRELADVSNFITSKMSSIRGQQENRRQAIQTLHEHGYTFITTKNYKDFTNYMDEVKTLFQSRKYPPSEELYEVYKEAKKRGVSSQELLKNLDAWLENRTKISKLTKKQTEGKSSSEILHMLVKRNHRGKRKK